MPESRDYAKLSTAISVPPQLYAGHSRSCCSERVPHPFLHSLGTPCSGTNGRSWHQAGGGTMLIQRAAGHESSVETILDSPVAGGMVADRGFVIVR